MATSSLTTAERPALKITALPLADAAKAMSSSYGRLVTEEQVREVAERGGLLRTDGAVNLIEYTAYLVREMAHGTD